MDTPVPIPNTEVKHFNADGSTMCESRKLPGFSLKYGGLAQLGEHLPYKQRVGGSSPSFRTKASVYWLDASRTCVVGLFEWRGETP